MLQVTHETLVTNITHSDLPQSTKTINLSTGERIEQRGDYEISLSESCFQHALERLPRILNGDEILEYCESLCSSRKFLFTQEGNALPLLSHEEEIIYFRALRFYEFLLNPKQGDEMLEEDQLSRMILPEDDNKKRKIPFFEEDENRYFFSLINQLVGEEKNKHLDTFFPFQLYKILEEGNLSEEEYSRYVKGIQEAIVNIKAIILSSNKGLIIKQVRKYSAQNTKLQKQWEDMFQKVNEDLMTTALVKNNHTFGLRLSTYFSWWIRQSCQRFCFKHNRITKIPVHLQEKFSDMRKHLNALGILNYYSKEAREALKKPFTEKEVDDFFRYNGSDISLDEEIQKNDNESQKSLYYLIPAKQVSAETKILREESRDKIRELTLNSGLSLREISILWLRFGLFKERRFMLEEVGNMEGVTKERIRQIENRALKKISESKSNAKHKRRRIVSESVQESDVYKYIILNQLLPYSIKQDFLEEKNSKFLLETIYPLIVEYYGLEKNNPRDIETISKMSKIPEEKVSIILKQIEDIFKNRLIDPFIVSGNKTYYQYLEGSRRERLSTF
jgi:RNA polymerase sigma factor (sigma-70 family)